MLAALIVLLVQSSPATSGPAPAQPEGAGLEEQPRADPESRRLYRRGLDQYDRGHYDQAARLFQAAFDRSRAPRILYNIAQAFRLNGQCAEAAAYYRRFIDAVPASSYRAGAEARLAESQRCAAALVPTVPPAPAPAPEPPLPAPAPAPPITAPPGASAQAGDPGPRATSGRVWGAFLLGTTVVSGGAAAFFAWRADQAADRTSRLYSLGGAWDQAARDNEAAGKQAQRAAWALTIGSAATAGLATWLLLRDEPHQLAVLEFGPGRAVGGWRARF